MFQGIKQLEEKNVASEINCMVWSSRMDLVAFSNAKGLEIHFLQHPAAAINKLIRIINDGYNDDQNITALFCHLTKIFDCVSQQLPLREVALHRLSWTRAWVLSPQKEGQTVNNIAWRPDGKVLAIAYNDGSILLINIETKAILNKFDIAGEITFVSWVQEKVEAKPKNIYKLKDDDKDILKFVDLSKPYIRDPPPVSHLEGSINFEDIKGLTSFLQEQSEFNLLIIGTKEGILHVRVFGCWNCLVLNVSDKVGYKCSIQNAHFTEDLSKLFITVIDEQNNINTILFDSNIFKAHSGELYHVTMKYIKIYELILYLAKILTSITETWESILLEIDKKLAKYASKVPEGGVTADFLALLMQGLCSERLEEFLICDLTKKGLEKFGQTMEVSYSNIQSYLFRHIIKYSQNGTFHLSELKGMAKFEERFGVIGLNEDLIQKAIRSNGAFVIKAGEMQQIINHSVINYKAFFRWLYASIMHLMEEPIPSEIQKMTQQDLACITEFLKNFDSYGQRDGEEGRSQKFIMERLGQYLVNEDLIIKPDMSGNDWTRFLEENACLKNNTNILTHYEDKSLIQVFNELKNNIEKVFQSPLVAIERAIDPISKFNCFNFGKSEIVISSMNVSNDMLLLAILKPSKSIYLFQVLFDSERNCQARCGKFFFSDEQLLDIIDTKFYSSNILTVLLQETNENNKRGGILQLSMASALEQLVEVNLFSQLSEENIPNINGWTLGQRHFKSVEMPVTQISVSGTRRVSIVLSENKRKVKLFEMECEEDEEEEVNMSTSTIKEDSFML